MTPEGPVPGRAGGVQATARPLTAKQANAGDLQSLLGQTAGRGPTKRNGNGGSTGASALNATIDYRHYTDLIYVFTWNLSQNRGLVVGGWDHFKRTHKALEVDYNERSTAEQTGDTR